MAATIKKSVLLKFGMVTAVVDVLAALQPRSHNITVCQGANGHEDHAPAQIKVKTTCVLCGDIHASDTRKARRVGDGVVILDNNDLAESVTVTDEQKTSMTLTPSKMTDVLARTVNGSKVYHLVPQRGNGDAYHAILGMIAANPDLAFMIEWAPRSLIATFRVGVRDGVLIAEERVPAEQLQEAPELPEPSARVPAYVTELNRAVSKRGVITAFQPPVLDDVIAHLITTRTPVPEYKADKPNSTASSDALMEQMFASIQQANKGVRRRKVTA